MTSQTEYDCLPQWGDHVDTRKAFYSVDQAKVDLVAL